MKRKYYKVLTDSIRGHKKGDIGYLTKFDDSGHYIVVPIRVSTSHVKTAVSYHVSQITEVTEKEFYTQHLEYYINEMCAYFKKKGYDTIEEIRLFICLSNNVRFTLYQLIPGYGIIERAKYLFNKMYPVVVEPEFVLPENWFLPLTNKTLPYANKYRFSKGRSVLNNCDEYDGIYLNGWGCDNNSKRVEITLEQFKKHVLKEEDTFVLPEKWCLKMSTREISNSMTRKYCNLAPLFWEDLDIYKNALVDYKCRYHCAGSFPKDCTEITFEQFQKHVLNQEPVKAETTKVETTESTKVFTLKQIREILSEDYDKSDVDDIIKSLEEHK